MKHYENIVVGAGASGLTLASLLALNGRSVLLLEKAPHVVGGLVRFQKGEVAFDTGFHFTGGFNEEGLLCQMLNILGLRNAIEAVYLADEKSNRYVFERDHSAYDFPAGVKEFSEKLKTYFPDESSGIDRYFDMAKRAYEQVLSLDFRKNIQSTVFIDEDFMSLRQVLDSLFKHPHLKGILSTYCMCYGVRPSEISFANHCRVAYGLYEAVARIKDGGDAVIKAFEAQPAYSDIDIRLGSYITECAEVTEQKVGRFILNTGEEVSFDQCIFTIHPKEIVNILPKTHLSKAFLDRVESFEASSGFFALYGILEKPDERFQPCITSLFPVPDVDQLLDPESKDPTAIVVLTSEEVFHGKSYQLLTALEPAFVEQMAEWKDSSVGNRPESYRRYKEEHVAHIIERVTAFYPQYRNNLKIVDAASMLTFRDYLHSYDGTAYGIKQKMGQFNLFGKLPYRNLYAAGQSALLPGLVGAMMSAFIVARNILGRDQYVEFIRERLPA